MSISLGSSGQETQFSQATGLLDTVFNFNVFLAIALRSVCLVFGGNYNQYHSHQQFLLSLVLYSYLEYIIGMVMINFQTIISNCFGNPEILFIPVQRIG